MTEQELEDFYNLCFKSAEVKRFFELIPKFQKHTSFNESYQKDLVSIAPTMLDRELHIQITSTYCDMDRGESLYAVDIRTLNESYIARIRDSFKRDREEHLRREIAAKKSRVEQTASALKYYADAVKTALSSAQKHYENALEKHKEAQQELDDILKGKE